jgi:sortase (surface protein transpeptidase)
MNAHLPGTTRQRLGVLAGALAVIGAVVIVVAACTSRSGPPQPSAAQAGSVAVQTEASSTPDLASSAAQPSTAPATSTPRSSAAPASTKPAPTTSVKPTAPSKPATSTTSPATPSPLLLASSIPTKLSIPSIGVSSDLLQLGLNPDGTVEVQSLDDPNSKAGWYDRSPTPGAIGPAILLGHVDSKKYGPGVFYQLGALGKGAEVDVTRSDGSVAVFVVNSVESYPKDNFPTQTVYQNLPYAGLRLITCGGTFDPQKGSYESNIVAFATLSSVRKA